MNAESDVQWPVQPLRVGGPGLDRRSIASASIRLDGAALAVQPQAGGLFVASPGVRGVPEIPSAG